MDWDYIANKFSSIPDRLLYHYTDVRGLEGIINNEEIWLTEYGYLNDSSEGVYGIEIFKEVLGSGVFRDYNLFRDRFDYKVDFVDLVNAISRKEGVFCCSFTSEGNLLSQWRAYCPKEGGYSIGFSAESLKKLSKTRYFSFFRCIYKKEEQINIGLKVINEFLYYAENTDGFSQGQFQTHLQEPVTFFASAFKNNHFREEKEWRLVYSNKFSTNVCYRTKGNVINAIPYVKLPLPKNAIEEIIIGPCGNSHSAKRSLELLLKLKGMNPEIKDSGIPYRAF